MCNLNVQLPFTLRFPDRHDTATEDLLRDYCDKNAMLILSDSSILGGRMTEILELGYGYSCFSEPQEDEVDSDEGFADILDDCGRT